MKENTRNMMCFGVHHAVNVLRASLAFFRFITTLDQGQTRPGPPITLTKPFLPGLHVKFLSKASCVYISVKTRNKEKLLAASAVLVLVTRVTADVFRSVKWFHSCVKWT